MRMRADSPREDADNSAAGSQHRFSTRLVANEHGESHLLVVTEGGVAIFPAAVAVAIPVGVAIAHIISKVCLIEGEALIPMATVWAFGLRRNAIARAALIDQLDVIFQDGTSPTRIKVRVDITPVRVYDMIIVQRHRQ